MANPVRLGVVGVGNMGSAHCRLLANIPEMEVTGVVDMDPARANRAAEKNGCPGFASATELLDSGLCEAVLIATPHFDHTVIGIEVLKRGLHLLVEKPISAHKADCEKLIRAHKDSRQVFAAMFNQRTDGFYKLIRTLVADGSLGKVQRLQWTITDWFRSQAYYDSGGWRATWAGEGGGVLLNQCPHQLDLLHWIFGMPRTVSARAALGKYHDIEVEDDVTALLTYANGATGIFSTTTGEAPGINRLEVAGENGLLTYDTRDPHVLFRQNNKPVSDAILENSGFQKPDTEILELKPETAGQQHAEVLVNFARAILDGTALIAPAAEGIHSVELANAMLLSAARGRPVDLPLSSRAYANHLRRLISTSRYRRDNPSGGGIADMSDSF